MPKLLQQIEQNIWIGKHQIWIIDFDVDWDGNYDNSDPYDIGIGVTNGVIGFTDFSRAAGFSPVLIEHYETDPGIDDINDYSGVMEASINVSSGQIAIESIDTKDISISVPPGIYHMRIYYGNDDTCRYDYSDGANHARIVLFPTTEKKDIRILKKKDNVDNPSTIYKGTRSESELIAMLTSPIISYNCIATVALLQLGKLNIVKEMLKYAPDSVKRVFTSALWMIGKDALPELAELAENGEDDIRTRVMDSLELLATDEAIALLSTISENENDFNDVKEKAEYTIARIKYELTGKYSYLKDYENAYMKRFNAKNNQ